MTNDLYDVKEYNEINGLCNKLSDVILFCTPYDVRYFEGLDLEKIKTVVLTRHALGYKMEAGLILKKVIKDCISKLGIQVSRLIFNAESVERAGVCLRDLHLFCNSVHVNGAELLIQDGLFRWLEKLGVSESKISHLQTQYHEEVQDIILETIMAFDSSKIMCVKAGPCNYVSNEYYDQILDSSSSLLGIHLSQVGRKIVWLTIDSEEYIACVSEGQILMMPFENTECYSFRNLRGSSDDQDLKENSILREKLGNIIRFHIQGSLIAARMSPNQVFKPAAAMADLVDPGRHQFLKAKIKPLKPVTIGDVLKENPPKTAWQKLLCENTGWNLDEPIPYPEADAQNAGIVTEKEAKTLLQANGCRFVRRKFRMDEEAISNALAKVREFGEELQGKIKLGDILNKVVWDYVETYWTKDRRGKHPFSNSIAGVISARNDTRISWWENSSYYVGNIMACFTNTPIEERRLAKNQNKKWKSAFSDKTAEHKLFWYSADIDKLANVLNVDKKWLETFIRKEPGEDGYMGLYPSRPFDVHDVAVFFYCTTEELKQLRADGLQVKNMLD